MRGRDGEWQWPAAALPTRDLLRGITAMGFSALTLDRYGYRRRGVAPLHQLKTLLGAPIATPGRSSGRVGPVGRAHVSDRADECTRPAGARAAADRCPTALPLHRRPTDRRPGRSSRDLRVRFAVARESRKDSTSPRARDRIRPRSSATRRGYLTIHGHRTPISTDRRVNHISVELRPGTTTVEYRGLHSWAPLRFRASRTHSPPSPLASCRRLADSARALVDITASACCDVCFVDDRQPRPRLLSQAAGLAACSYPRPTKPRSGNEGARVTVTFPDFAVACGEEASDPTVFHAGSVVRVDELTAQS